MNKRKTGWFTHVFFLVSIFVCLIKIAESPEDRLINLKKTNINIHSEPGTNYNVVGQIKPNEEVSLITVDKKAWAKIKWKEKEAYVFFNLLTKKEKESKAGTVFVLTILLVIYFRILKGKGKEKIKSEWAIKKDDSIDVSIEYGSGSYSSKIPDVDSNKLWIPTNQSIEVQKIKIDKGNIYVGKALRSVQNEYQIEAALINPSLKVNHSKPDYDGQTMSYWPSYSDIDPRARSAYLKWLAGSRSDESANIGYVFLYFYGIERRLLIDAERGRITKAEIKSLISEVNRLLAVYGNNGSFREYASSFVDFVSIRFFSDKIGELDLKQTKSYDLSPLLKWKLAKYAAEGKSIPGEIAFQWIDNDPDTRFRVPAHRCKKELKSLFLTRYREQFGDGIVVKQNKTGLVFNYRPASPSLYSLDFSVTSPAGHSDVTAAPSNIKRLRNLAEQCVDELDAYSRYLGSKKAKPGSIEAEALLPKPLLLRSANTRINNLKTWLEQNTNDLNPIQASSLLKFWGYEDKKSITKKEVEYISILLEKLGYGFEPDLRYHSSKIDSQGLVFLFKQVDAEFTEPDEAFLSMSLLLRLGAIIAHADGTFCDREKKYLKKLIDQQIHLKKEQKLRLTVYLEWLLNTQPNMVGLKNKLSVLDEDQKKNIAEIMLQTANADGIIDPEEIKQLEKIYKMLGIATDAVIADLHSLKATSSQPIIVQKATVDQTEYDIPEQPKDDVKGVVLDIKKIGLIEKDTKEIQSILKPIFSEEEQVSEIELEQSESDIQGLSKEYADLFHKLITQKQWPRDEIEKICNDQNLMIDGALETINEFALDKVGELLVEEYEGNFIIEAETTKEILNEED